MTNVMDKFSIPGQVAIVTGGAGLLGSEFCRTLAQAGARVIVADSNRNHAELVANDISVGKLEAHPDWVDVTDQNSVQSLVDRVVEKFGRIDILVCSAALDPKFEPGHEEKFMDSFEEHPLSLWQQSLEVNLTGIFLSAQACSKVMLDQNRGVMVFISSTYGLVGPDQRIYQLVGSPAGIKPVSYSVTKAGVLGLTKYLAAYYAGKNIRVNALTPGGVYNQHDAGFVQNYSTKTILGRMAEKDEMNAALLFLASDASSYMTGANLIVDGGWTAW